MCVSTHPTQYFAPWFRYLHEHVPEIALHAVYATVPSPQRQGVGFGGAFAWDLPLLEGYPNTVVRAGRESDDVHSSAFWGVDVPEIGAAVKRLRPDAVVVFGWYSATLLRALAACRRAGIPTLYRGDTNLASAPAGWRRRLWALKNRFLVTQAFEGYLSVGERCRKFLAAMGAAPERIFHTPHCVDNRHFAETALPWQRSAERTEFRQALGASADDFAVLFVGKLESKKRPSDVVEAVRRLGRNAVLIVVGSGPLESDLREQAAKTDLRTHFAGFVNQSQIGRYYAAADVLALPSDGQETWGLVVNEALATGLPCVVSDAVGCAPDLIETGATGEVFPLGDPAALAAALERVRHGLHEGTDFAAACRRKAEDYSFRAAGQGLLQAVRAVVRRKVRPTRAVVAACGTMSFVGGLERQTFNVLAALRASGQPVHVIGNAWAAREADGRHPIERLATEIGAGWSVGHDWRPLATARSPRGMWRLLVEFVRVGRDLVRRCQRCRANFVLLPDMDYPLRNMFALPWLRQAGVKVVERVGVAPLRQPIWQTLWGLLYPRLVEEFVANSEFGVRRLRECGVPKRRIRCIKNSLAKRGPPSPRDLALGQTVAVRRTVLCVGQIAPFKGVHLLLEAAARLRQRGVGAFGVAIVGRVPDWPAEAVAYYERLKTEGEKTGGVEFLGEVEGAPHLMERAYVLAAPIVQEETFGNVVLEALAAGLPAVVTPRGGLPELVAHGRTGYICRDVSAEALADGLAWFLESPERRDAAAAECRAVVQSPDWPYRPERFAAAWRDAFSMKGRWE